jgi:transposase
MPAKRYKVDLSEAERLELEQLTHKGKISARKMKRAQILLKASAGWTDEQIAEALDTGRATVERIRQRFVERGLVGALTENAHPAQKRRLDGRAEAHLIALACSERPEGQVHWSMRVLAAKLVEMEVVDSISHETVRQTLKKTQSSPGK